MTDPQSPKPGALFVISGPSGVGKSTIIDRLLDDPRFSESVSATTRPQRPNEIAGRDYVFLERAEFERRVKKGDFVEWACVHGEHLYGTLVSEIERIKGEGRIAVLDVDVQGAAAIRGKHDAVFIFIAPPSIEALLVRLAERGTETEESRRARLDSARRELAEQDKYDHVVVNDRLDEAVERVRALLPQAASQGISNRDRGANE